MKQRQGGGVSKNPNTLRMLSKNGPLPYESHLMLSSVRPAGVPLHFLMHRLHLRLQRGSLPTGLLASCDIVLFHVISSWSIIPLALGRAFLGCSRVITPNWTNGASLIFVPSRRQATRNVVSDVDLSVRGVHHACTPFFSAAARAAWAAAGGATATCIRMQQLN